MKKELAMTNKDVELLIGQVDTKKQNGLTLPRGYSVSNAMNAAYLMLKDAEDKNGNKDNLFHIQLIGLMRLPDSEATSCVLLPVWPKSRMHPV